MEVQQATDQHEISDKKDDFFDDETPKQNGDLPNNMAAENEEDKVKDSSAKDGGDVTTVDEASAGDEVKGQDPDAVAASGGDGGEGTDNAAPQGEDGAEPAAAGKPDETADEGFQSTSPPPAPEVAAQQQQQEELSQPQEEEQQQQTSAGGEEDAVAGETQSAVDREVDEPSKPEADQQEKDAPQDEPSTQPEPEQQQQQEEQQQGDIPAFTIKAEGQEQEKEQEKKQQLQEDKPEAEAEDGGKYENDYEDSFSQCSQKSLASVDSTGKTLNPKIEVADDEKEGTPAVVSNDGELVSISPTPSPKAPSPTPSRDSRAEGLNTVDTPLPVEEPKTDGRSSVEIKENGEYRGEDRMDVTQPEGTEDSRGQGQWKSPEDQYIASAVLAQKTEQEALKEVQEERDQLLEEQTQTKSSLSAAEEELSRKSDLLVAEKEINASRAKKIKALEDELVTLYAKDGEGSEERIKDLQERLAVLARENEEKDQLIHRLNDDLRVTNLKLKDTEKQLALSQQECAQQAANAAEAPKSKTCVVM